MPPKSEPIICTICQGIFRISSQIITLNCGHFFHSRCILIQLQLGNTTCPICRGEIPMEQLQIYRSPSSPDDPAVSPSLTQQYQGTRTFNPHPRSPIPVNFDSESPPSNPFAGAALLSPAPVEYTPAISNPPASTLSSWESEHDPSYRSLGSLQSDVNAILLDSHYYVDLRYLNLSRRDLSFQSLHRRDLTGALLVYSNLTCADLTEAILVNAILIRVNITGVNWSRADVRGIIMTDIYRVTRTGPLQYTLDEINALFRRYNCIR